MGFLVPMGQRPFFCWIDDKMTRRGIIRGDWRELAENMGKYNKIIMEWKVGNGQNYKMMEKGIGFGG